MAIDQNQSPPDSNEQSAAGKMMFFRTRVAGLSIVVAPAGAGEVAPQMVRFTPISERYEGEQVKFGYLKTNNDVAIAKCLDDPNVEEITGDEYKAIFKKVANDNDPNTRLAAL
jgi:hypothetical protein